MSFFTPGHMVIGGIVFFATFLIILIGGTTLWGAWSRYVDRYAGMLKHEMDFMFVEMGISTAKLIVQTVVAGAALVGFLLFSGSLMGAFAFACIGLFIPRFGLRVAHDMRLDMFDVQLIDVVTMIKNSLKSGLGLQQAFEMVANEFTAPASQEMALVLKEIKMGADMDDALNNLMKRIPNKELQMVVTSIITLRTTGGNMVETFELIVQTIKERKKVEGKIKALTAQGKTQTRILLGMPFAMAFILSLMNPEFMSPLFNTIIGWFFLAVIGSMMTMGYLLIRKLTTIEV